MTPSEETAPIQDVPLQIEVELDRHSVTIRDILGFEEGTILALTRSAGENIDVYIGKRLVAYGEIVIIEHTMGVRITDFFLEP